MGRVTEAGNSPLHGTGRPRWASFTGASGGIWCGWRVKRFHPTPKFPSRSEGNFSYQLAFRRRRGLKSGGDFRRTRFPAFGSYGPNRGAGRFARVFRGLVAIAVLHAVYAFSNWTQITTASTSRMVRLAASQ